MSRTYSPARLRAARERAGMPVAAVCLKIHRSPETVSSYERGRVMPPVDVLVRLADLYSVSVDDLLDDRLAAGGGAQ